MGRLIQESSHKYIYDGEPGLAGLVEIEAATKTWKRIF